MVQQIELASDIIYPESDGKPLADNTIQFRLIVTIVGGLDTLFKDDQDVFVAGDLFWYPVEGQPKIKQAPDIMVIFGRPKGDRRSYKQWEEGNIAPQVVFEIASESNTQKELEEKKQQFYQRYGVQEYYIHDPDKGKLKGWIRSGDKLLVIEQMQGWVSPCLGVRFELYGKELKLYNSKGESFATYVEVAQRAEEAEEALEQTEATLEQTEEALEQTTVTLEQTEEALEQTTVTLEQTEEALKQERSRMKILLEQLKAKGIDPNDLGLSDY